MTIGIYAIRNKVNGKIYIGSSIHIEKRWSQHKYALERGDHHSAHLQNAWNEYGAEGFEFSIIEELLDVSELGQAEQRLLDRHKPHDPSVGYNIRSVVDRQTAQSPPIIRSTLTVQLPLAESDAFDRYSKKIGRNKSDIVREYIRTLSQNSVQLKPTVDTESIAIEAVAVLISKGLLSDYSAGEAVAYIQQAIEIELQQ